MSDVQGTPEAPANSVPNNIWAIIPAAGIGRRMQGDRPKQYLNLQNQSVISHTIQSIAKFSGLRGILIGVSADDNWWPETAKSLNNFPCELITFEGGAERADTVLLGLQRIQELSSDSDWVLVHDAVRPLVRSADIKKLVSSVSDDQDGGLLALPVADTLKSEQGGRVNKTIDRSHLWRALTPQFFPVARLINALQQCKKNDILVTDEASAMEYTGAQPRLIVGHADNIKITYPADLEMAELLLQTRDLN